MFSCFFFIPLYDPISVGCHCINKRMFSTLSAHIRKKWPVSVSINDLFHFYITLDRSAKILIQWFFTYSLLVSYLFDSIYRQYKRKKRKTTDIYFHIFFLLWKWMVSSYQPSSIYCTVSSSYLRVLKSD